MPNSREVDLSAWAVEQGALFRLYREPDDLIRAAGDTKADLLIAAGWHHLIPERVRSRFPRGCVGLHASLLPQYRGAAPLNWAILNGDREAGLSFFVLDSTVDGGPLYGQARFPIDTGDDVGDLVRKCEKAASMLLAECLPKIAAGASPIPQSGSPSYSLIRIPDDGWIDWRRDAASIVRLIRAVARPYPGAFCRLGDQEIRIWRAHVASCLPPVFGQPGQIASISEAREMLVVTGDGFIAIDEATLTDGSDAGDWLKQKKQHRFSLQFARGAD
jgi:methionyl-tRNA formyltransferase